MTLQDNKLIFKNFIYIYMHVYIYLKILMSAQKSKFVGWLEVAPDLEGGGGGNIL